MVTWSIIGACVLVFLWQSSLEREQSPLPRSVSVRLVALFDISRHPAFEMFRRSSRAIVPAPNEKLGFSLFPSLTFSNDVGAKTTGLGELIRTKQEPIKDREFGS